jgi:hypothetical protein
MIVISQLLSRIGALLKTATPQSADSAIEIPNTYLGPLPFPNQNPANVAGTFSDSFHMTFGNSITNNAGGFTQPLADVVPGVWEFSFTVDSEFNYLNANPVGQDHRITLFNSLGQITWYQMTAHPTRQVTVVSPFRMTMSDPINIRMLMGGNGVGQTSSMQVILCASRLL